MRGDHHGLGTRLESTFQGQEDLSVCKVYSLQAGWLGFDLQSPHQDTCEIHADNPSTREEGWKEPMRGPISKLKVDDTWGTPAEVVLWLPHELIHAHTHEHPNTHEHAYTWAHTLKVKHRACGDQAM